MSGGGVRRLPVVDDSRTGSVLRLRGPVDLAVVEAVVRLRLVARRSGCSLELEDAAPELVALLALTGLGLCLEPVGQPEAREQRGRVQEVVDVGDAAV